MFDVWYSLRVKLCDQCVIEYVHVEHKVCGSASMWKYVQSMWKYVQSMYKVCTKYVEVCGSASMWYVAKYVGGSAGGAEGESWAALRCRV